MDLKDLKEGRKPVHKIAMKERVRRVIRRASARETAQNIFASWRKKAAAVDLARGGPIRG